MQVKVQKNSSYFSRFQVKFRRRREGKTDYKKRLRLIQQDKTKFNTPKFRFVVRFTNKDIICQVIASKIIGDFVCCVAYSHELPRYGLKVGLANYPAAYATGLLCARRLLKKVGLDSQYEGKVETDGSFFLSEEPEDGPKPFKCFLDTGLKRSIQGAKVFGALKGAVDGGLHIPHSEKKFPGYGKKEYDPKVHYEKIMGKLVGDYMKLLKDSNEEKYNRQFSKYIKEGIKPDDLEGIYKKVHANIRADPAAKKKQSKVAEKHYDMKRTPKLTLEERKKKVEAKKEKLLQETLSKK